MIIKVSLIYEGLLRIRNKSSNRSKTAKSQFLSIISNVRNRTKGDKSQLSAKSQKKCESQNKREIAEEVRNEKNYVGLLRNEIYQIQT